MEKEELKKSVVDWAKTHGVALPSIYDDVSGISCLRTEGCGCCSTSLSEEFDYDDRPDFSDWTREDQLDVVKGMLRNILKDYGLKPSDLEEESHAT